MKANAIVEAIKTAHRARRPVFIHGQPGCGKSELVKQAAVELNCELRDVRASQLESVDLRGLPFIKNDTTNWSVPNFLPPMFVINEKTGKLEENLTFGILFLDELNQANQSTQAAAYQLILDRRLGDYILPVNWVVMAAGNRAVDRAIANKMGSALKNRFVHVELEVDNDEWLKWASKSSIHPAIIGYIRFRPTGLNDLGQPGNEGKKRMEAALEGNAFATPRSWFFASEIIKAQPNPDIEYELLKGTVGEANVADFTAFLRVYRNLPDLDDVIKNPDKHEVPKDPATRYALATGLACRTTKTNIENVLKFVSRMPAEFQVMVVKDAQSRDWTLTATKAYTVWLASNSHLM